MPRQQSLYLDLGAVAGAHEELPPLAALFLIHFDTKKGYTIEWARTADGGAFYPTPPYIYSQLTNER
jgi:hypothetical protein